MCYLVVTLGRRTVVKVSGAFCLMRAYRVFRLMRKARATADLLPLNCFNSPWIDGCQHAWGCLLEGSHDGRVSYLYQV